jgi:hypothetical protein
MLCAICIVYVEETRSAGFFSLAAKPLRQFLGLGIKTKVNGLASKPLLQFGNLGLKITAIVSWFGSQNQGGEVYRLVPQNR